jgi:hypothetical protein
VGRRGLHRSAVTRTSFGLGLYVGDLLTGRNGHAHGTFVGRFNIETFIVAARCARSVPDTTS